jgi:hypothetical protein
VLAAEKLNTCINEASKLEVLFALGKAAKLNFGIKAA